MKLGGQSADGIITSPFTPKKRKLITERKVLTEIRKKPNKRRLIEESDGETNSESESGDSGSDIPSAAFAKGREENLGDTSDSTVEWTSAPSPKKKTPSAPSPKKKNPFSTISKKGNPKNTSQPKR
jgi:hypothetical protein